MIPPKDKQEKKPIEIPKPDLDISMTSSFNRPISGESDASIRIKESLKGDIRIPKEEKPQSTKDTE